jgi:EmrB/QacA subfamily drug resistance transporter
MQTAIKIANGTSLSALPRRQIMITLAGVMMAMFLSSLDQTVVGTAMPRIIADLGGFSKYTWVTTAYIITSAVTVPITGKLIDMYGRKGFYVIGICIFLLGSLLCGLSHSMTQLILFRGFQGIGAGIMMANAFTVIGDLFPPAERGKYQGYVSGIFGLSSVIGPTVGGFLTDTVSWHWVFFVNIPLGIAVIALFIKFFPSIKPDNLKHRIDYAGVSALILCVVPALIALSWGGIEYPWGSPEIMGMFILAAIMLGVFLFIEQRAKEPILPLSLFKNKVVTVCVTVTFLSSIGMFGSTTFIPLFFQGILGVSATLSGNYLIPMMFGVLCGSFVSGQLISRGGGHYRVIGIIGTAILCTGLFLFSRLNADTRYGIVVLFMIITGLGLGSTMPVFTIGVQNAVPYSMLGVATSASTFFRSIGGSIGLAVLGSVMSNRFASHLMTSIPESVRSAVPPDTLSSMVNNPQALVSPDAQVKMREMFAQLGNGGASLFDQLLHGLRQALASAISEVFLIGFAIALVGLVTTFFLKEIPLRKRNEMVSMPVDDEAAKKPAD